VTFGEQLARLRVAAATGRLSQDLGRWVLRELERIAPVAAAREERDQALRAAVAGVSGSRWARARRLQRELLALGSGRARAAEDDPVRAAVRRALALDADCPLSLRQLLRVLADQ
jgi:hypothetical protein